MLFLSLFVQRASVAAGADGLRVTPWQPGERRASVGATGPSPENNRLNADRPPLSAAVSSSVGSKSSPYPASVE